MTRIPSLLAAATLAILPISAFAQQDAAPAKTAPSAGVVSTPANTPASSAKTLPSTSTTAAKPMAPVTQPTKPDVKTGVAGGKTEMHGHEHRQVARRQGQRAHAGEERRTHQVLTFCRRHWAGAATPAAKAMGSGHV